MIHPLADSVAEVVESLEYYVSGPHGRLIRVVQPPLPIRQPPTSTKEGSAA